MSNRWVAILVAGMLGLGVLTGRAGWEVSRVVDGVDMHSMAARSVALDATGEPVVAFTGDHLYVTQYAHGTWQTEIVDEASLSPGRPALQLGPLDMVRLAYVDAGSGMLKYAYQVYQNAAFHWVVEGVAPASGLSEPSLVLDAAGYPHIAYRREGGALGYARKNTTGWYTVPVDPELMHSPSLALTGAGEARIAYLKEFSPGSTRGKLFLAEQICSILCSWQSEEVDTDMNAGGTESPQLVLDSNDDPHITMIQNSTAFSAIWHVYQNGAEWITDWDDTFDAGYIAYGVKQELDALDRRHVVWRDAGSDLLVYHGPTGTVDLEPATIDTEWFAVTVDTNDLPRVAYLRKFPILDFNPLSQEIREIRHTGAFWTSKSLVRTGDIDHFDLAVSPAGLARMAYYDPAEETLHYGTHDGTHWNFSNADSDVAIDDRFALALTTTDLPRMAYLDDDSGALMLIQYSSAGPFHWTTSTVDADGGEGIQLEVDAAHVPHLAYEKDSALHYAFKEGGGYIRELVDDGLTVYAHSLALDQAGHPRIAYGGSPNEIRLATRVCGFTGCNWVPASVTNRIPFEIYLRYDAMNKPHIMMDSHYMEYLYQVGTTWFRESVHPTDQALAFALDPNGNPHGIYEDEGIFHTFRFCLSGPCFWFPETIPGAGKYAWRPRFEIDSLGGMHLLYYHDGDIYYAYKGTPLPDPRITAISKPSMSHVALSWGGAYQDVYIYRSPALNPPVWIPVAGPLAGDQHTLTNQPDHVLFKLSVEP